MKNLSAKLIATALKALIVSKVKVEYGAVFSNIMLTPGNCQAMLKAKHMGLMTSLQASQYAIYLLNFSKLSEEKKVWDDLSFQLVEGLDKKYANRFVALEINYKNETVVCNFLSISDQDIVSVKPFAAPYMFKKSNILIDPDVLPQDDDFFETLKLFDLFLNLTFSDREIIEHIANAYNKNIGQMVAPNEVMPECIWVQHLQQETAVLSAIDPNSSIYVRDTTLFTHILVTIHRNIKDDRHLQEVDILVLAKIAHKNHRNLYGLLNKLSAISMRENLNAVLKEFSSGIAVLEEEMF